GEEKVMLLEAAGHGLALVNGEPRAGDPYSTGQVVLPVRIRAGENQILLSPARGGLRARLTTPRSWAFVHGGDMTLPDAVEGQTEPLWAGIIVTLARSEPAKDLVITAQALGASDTGALSPVGEPVVSDVGAMPALSARKAAVQLPPPGAALKGDRGAEARYKLTLARREADGRPGATLDTFELALRVRTPAQARKVTFLSAIDRSVQYYALVPALVPASSQPGPGPAPGLVLSLHGASVEAISQAESYAAKPAFHIAAPTNRRPFGFDWEDWGRLDALEVLDLALAQTRADASRVMLTGHSMGGHGTWSLGTLFPDRFAAIAPSAGWASFATYGGMRRPDDGDPVVNTLWRASNISLAQNLLPNLAPLGISILHGDKDDNVPVSEARTLRDALASIHPGIDYHEQPGAGHWWDDDSGEPGAACVDWPGFFELFSRRRIPALAEIRRVKFITPNPGVSARAHWATVVSQINPLAPSTIDLTIDPAQRRLRGTTVNVQRLSIDLAEAVGAVGAVGVVGAGAGSAPLTAKLDLDGTKIADLALKGALHLRRVGDRWEQTDAPGPQLKGPGRAGPFKEAFNHGFMLVYATGGTPDETAAALAKARYDAETFMVRGNGAPEVLSDDELLALLAQPVNADNPAAHPSQRGLILYGNETIHKAWPKLVGASPVRVTRDSIAVGTRVFEGPDLGALVVRPRVNAGGGGGPLVGLVAWTGPAGARAALPARYFTSGVHFADFTVFASRTLREGGAGILGAGYFAEDWSLDPSNTTLREPPTPPPAPPSPPASPAPTPTPAPQPEPTPAAAQPATEPKPQ
ncbi:MAG: prolyl oligopeptidase family serine peptidase, partial [Planctomycetota bacterium]|nr:prolyl oligopeptidase family serine peptidase [Planctomycetota bacterium]